MISVNDHCCMIILIFTGKTTKIVIVTFVLLQLGTTAGLHFSIILSLSHIYALSKRKNVHLTWPYFDLAYITINLCRPYTVTHRPQTAYVPK